LYKTDRKRKNSKKYARLSFSFFSSRAKVLTYIVNKLEKSQVIFQAGFARCAQSAQ